MADYKLAERDYMSGMKYKDIAEKYGVSLATVKSWKTRYGWSREGMHTKNKKSMHTKERKNPEEKQRENSAFAQEQEETELTEKQEMFCLYFVRCFNATKAYQKAYDCDYNSARAAASKLLTNINIKTRIRNLKSERISRELLDESDIFQKYIDIAFADMSDYIEWDKNRAKLRSSNMVDGTLVSEVTEGKYGLTIKIPDIQERMKALQWLSEHMKLATEEQKARIAIMKAKIEGVEYEQADDGFIEALNATAGEDWTDEEDNKTDI